ncbi:serine hydrolase [Streptacidiphilus melanogenes]|uniref:serine hydrolase n=1 Tax=Streptacidiphilus melanogenes TaxID=411235 RepID=UPI000693F8DE|nr:serine hydrolase [Streptacidiphilus melanogenes]
MSSDADSAATLDRILGQAPLHAAVAVLDPGNGRTLVRDDGSHAFVTASIAKVDILSTLLLERQDAGASGLTSAQRALATRMIEASDNGCANQLFRQAGGAQGLSRANRRFGLTHTHVHDPHWGLTTTTASDQLRLLQQVFTPRSVLSASSRAYIQRLMGQVEADQNWGVSAAADGSFALKNGWLPRNDGTWTINSIGGVVRHGRLLLIAVLSDKDVSETAGITLAQAVAKAAATAVGGP